MPEVSTTKQDEQPAPREVALDIDQEIAYRKQEIALLQGELRAYETLKKLQAKATITVPAPPNPYGTPSGPE